MTNVFQDQEYKLAILFDSSDPCPPSDLGILKNFIELGKLRKIEVKILNKNDLALLKNFDGLFIRTTTYIHNYAYRWVEMAEWLGLDLIDSTKGISFATNKYLQYEHFKKYNISMPMTQIIYSNKDLLRMINSSKTIYPLVLKITNGTCCIGCYKIKDKNHFNEVGSSLLKKGNIHNNDFVLIAQEYVYTSFDWRIGILDQKVLFACKYYMFKNSWQVVNYKKNGKFAGAGIAEAVNLSEVPQEILSLSLQSVKHLNPGLYGVDLKQKDSQNYIIEINDAPDLYEGIENGIIKENIYNAIFEAFLSRSQYRVTHISGVPSYSESSNILSS